MKRKSFLKGNPIFIAALVFLVIGCVLAGVYGLVSAETANAGETIPPPAKDGVSELGTENNPLFILEIVPNKSFSEIGYWIPGCEPVDMDKLSIDSLAYTYKSRQFADCTAATEYKYEFEIDAEELASGAGNWDSPDDIRGYFQKVSDGTGTIKQEKNGSNYTYTYVGEGQGQYVWVADNNYSAPTDHTADKVWLSVKRYSRTKMLFVHKNTFLKEAIRVPADKLGNYKTVVITVDPTDLANSANLELINKADIIYINGKNHDINDGMVSIWNKFNKEGITLNNPPADFKGDNDLTWDAVMAIFNRMVSKNRASVVLDLTTVYLSGESDNNAHKLCIMLLQMGPANFDRLLVTTGKIKTTTVSGKVTGYYVGKNGNEIITKWDQNTFPDNGAKTKYGDLVLKNPYMTASNTTVGEGVYTYNGDMSLLENLNSKNINEITVTKDAFDFYEYWDKYEKENADPNSARRASLTPAEAIFFLLHQKFDWADKKELNILEIEPYDSFVYGSAGWEARYRKFFPYFMGGTEDIHVTTMTTYDYIGKIEDINSKYDMIILGLNTGYKDITKYNDQNLKGKIYLSIGDMVNADSSIRYSGNDLTKRKLDQLKSFMQSGKPVMLTSGFYTDTTRSKVSAYVDKASYVYNLADVIEQPGLRVYTDQNKIQAQRDYRAQYKDRIFYEDNFNSYILERKLTDCSCSLEFADKSDSSMYPVAYNYTTKADGSISTVQYNSSNTLKYKFKIKGSADKYAVKLYIDNNGDGKYNGSLDTPTDAKQEVISSLTVKDEGNRNVNVNSLKPDTWYTVIRHLDASYQGIIPWKLEVNAVGNNSIRASEINYTVIKQTSEANKVKLKVLQVVIDAGTGDQSTNLNMQTDTRFQKYLNSVAEYKVDITFMSNSTFLRLYRNCTGDAVSGKYDFLTDYDMLILGFRDCCSYTHNKYANQNIQDFIKQGKSVIFSHDVIWDKDAGQERLYNDMLRKIMSQDRFHFTTGISGNSQPIYYNDTTNNLISNPIRIYDSGANLASGTDKYWKFYTDNSNKLYWRSGNGYNYDRNDTTSSKSWGNLSFMETTRISIANRGQITQYPFKINDTISISTTHTQYYQLDLEEDDMVVWYNLSDSKSKLNGGNNNGFYSSRENDSRNNYYIYNKGNITYTGLGHTVNLTDDEIKLFINTMISSYRAGTAKPKLVVTNDDVYTVDSDEQYLFINSDTDTITTTDTSQVKTVKFRVEEESVVNTSDRDYYVSYYAVLPDPADSTRTIRVQLNPQANSSSTSVLPTKNVDTDGICMVVPGKGTKLNSDNEFAIDVPLKYFNGEGKLLIEMDLTSIGKDEDNNVIEQNSVTKLTLITKPYFDLD
ncbi:DUF5057 domain-containing protein [Anaerocolumna xylanovorans]|uniref:Uncharacterized protein n=1 Tax=Anaerocolumna xylanovorans DSM 12503 TaxID=1121345 RepID=A0A1M7YMX7_9FIRM|nr:DUF5057 domain-containing protein [Anaerocolumna xylanovorans]SHO53932.1 protein of unknown function [Anaerocolumna xylanovorans DSM 12503]